MEATDAAHHLAVHRAAPQKRGPAQNVSWAEAEKPALRNIVKDFSPSGADAKNRAHQASWTETISNL